MSKIYKLILLFIFIIIPLYLNCSIFAPDPDIIVHCEVDYVSGCVPILKYTGALISSTTKNEEANSNRRGLDAQASETNLDLPEDITESELRSFCEDHDELSEDISWWVYIIGIKKIYNSNLYAGTTLMDGGSTPGDPSDNDFSATCVKAIEYLCDPVNTADLGIASNTAHEIFHQFHVDHCPYNQSCIMFSDLGQVKNDPPCDICSDHADDFKLGKP